uniref:NADH-ubiquinone/plastoquinone oxidoreductase chain 3 (NuoA) n=1 Tax=uncultured marine thaumarchaeote KM3_26_F01 TaxID=1456108 RepID=A0A075GWA2_9ARCH|nr:NADH-ubiquinone/plastoquinone oxidoreductase chain 3 (nuoA) [uncultured marine thaumarchaeote KM3_26_F01]
MTQALNKFKQPYSVYSNMVSSEFGIILAMTLAGVVFSLPTLIIPYFFAPKKRNPIKLQTFEAGQPPTGESRIHLIMQYYSYLIMFVIFDVTVMFLFAWGLSFTTLGIQSLVSLLPFLAVILCPMVYALHLAGRRENW